METFKNTYTRTEEMTKEKNLTFLKEEFQYSSTVAINEVAETAAEFVRDCSTTFCKDIATQILAKKGCSEKQAWCIAFEFFKIQHQFAAWAEKEISSIEKN